MNWKIIEGFENYRVSDTGEVQSRYSGDWKSLKTTFGDKYPRAVLYRNQIRYERQVHDLVLEAFVGQKPPKAEVCHWNGNHQDNRLENLRYGDHVENAKDRIRHETISRPNGEKNSQSKLTEKIVLEIRDLLNEGITHREIAKIYGVSPSSVTHINTRSTWTHI